jgi:hypothetical protein
MDRSVHTAPGWSPAPAIVAALFALALAPALIDHLHFHPDERHYVDAGLMMLETGDWLTPRTSDGGLRLQKPILPYWAAAAGGAVLGPSPFSLRIVFLLAGAVIVWWGSRVAREAWGTSHAAGLTALLLACHPALLISATRSVPDVILSLSIAISMGGFVTLITRGRADWSALLTAYVGGALAILSKGLPGVVFVGYASVFLFFAQPTLVKGEWRRFAVCGGLCGLLGGSWFWVMRLWHGSAMSEQFMLDQIASYRFAEEPLQFAWQALFGVLLLVASFTLLIAPSLRPLIVRRRDVGAFCRQPVSLFLVGWIALFLVCSATINHISLRYVLPAAVPGAILLGGLLTAVEGPLLRRNVRGLAWVSLAFPPAAAVIFVTLRGSTAPALVAIVIVATCGVIAYLYRQMRYTSLIRSASVLTASLLASVLLLGWGAVTSAGPSFGFRVVSALEAELGDAFETTTVTFIGQPAHAARLRVCSGGRLHVRHLFPHEAPLRPNHGVVVTLDGILPQSATAELEARAVPCGFDDLSLTDAWQAFRADSLRAYFLAHQREYQVLQMDAPISAQPQRVADQPQSEAIR